MTSNMNSSATRRTKSFFNSATSNAMLIFLLTTCLTIACTAASCPGGGNINGDVRIGSGNVISPSACISAEAGPIIIGKRNVIEADVVIANRKRGRTLVVGDDNVFKLGTVCEGRVGDRTVLGPRAYIGQDVVVGNDAVVGLQCSITKPGTIPPNTVIDVSKC